MAPDEYSTGGGGKLKLKGSKVADGRVEKKKKKKEKKEMKERESGQEVKDGSGDDVKSQEKPGSPEYERGQGEGGPKTETEKKYEEMRRKRLRERLQRDGVKTHKERVEDLNKYLSRLSEHHDMPKIGPG
ncbi:uncharacterized protein N7469_008361 [Penicillium citrinum]|uniref:DUF1754-domain-containing protein n=2 Tax=Penicillium TaxID=5073 RepID=A0A9W9NTR7_PENCI|nr:uncharacterized protein N7469_008361 [Penicillium citrinum]KAJ5224858.1 hypothetical protein N7469_008361 [Penicillium citrinum]KAJ5575115.1 hypothetical protein N7450_009014 [Penicillium hetheringtonii]